jgi:hypothetical protein
MSFRGPYIVFQDSFAGFKHIYQINGDNLQEVIQSIHEGCTGMQMPSQHFMYYIYKKHHTNVPLLGIRFDTWKRVKAVAGTLVENPQQRGGHEYALQHNRFESSDAWFFTDNMCAWF